MRLTKLILRNIQYTIRNYPIYFFTLILGAAFYYIFQAGETQISALGLLGNDALLTAIMYLATNMVSYIFVIILSILLLHMNRYLVKRRSHEFMTYMLLGMGKWRITLLLHAETLIIGSYALFVGLIIGIGFSQLMGAALTHTFSGDMAVYRFIISYETIRDTIITFVFLHLLVMLLNSGSVAYLRSIDPHHARQGAVIVKEKNRGLCILAFFASLSLFYIACRMFAGFSLQNMPAFVICLAVLFAAVFLLLWSFNGFTSHVSPFESPLYYRGLNAFTSRSITKQFTSSVASLTIVSLLLAMALFVLYSFPRITDALDKGMEDVLPVDFLINYKPESPDAPQDLDALFEASGSRVNELLGDHVRFCIYCDPEFTFAESFGPATYMFPKDIPPALLSSLQQLVKESDYNRFMTLIGKETVSLEKDEYIAVCDYKTLVPLDIASTRNSALRQSPQLMIFNHLLRPKYLHSVDGTLLLSYRHSDIGFLVIPDEIVDASCRDRDYLIGNYPVKDQVEAEQYDIRFVEQYEIAEKYLAAHGFRTFENTLWLSGRIDHEQSALMIGTVLPYITLYLSLIFLLTCGATLGIRVASDSVDNVRQYNTLRQIGVEEAELNRSLRLQTLYFFLMPLIVAIPVFLIIVQPVNSLLAYYGKLEWLVPAIRNLLLFLVIYGGYCIIAYTSEKNAISPEN